ncbi:MAG: LysR family transcriptional regulator [Spirochaetales bacterium]|nr:LysR family transcriptional regulator [Spirochaetales bacterium]MBR1582494.1 LysR family transcriptional regulator [Spirochaetales bacterium]
MDFTAKIMLFDSDLGFFGPGVRDLFLNIESEHSVKGASENMGLSYSKAWKMIRNVEKALGEPAVTRTHGGTEGGSAQLTDAGRMLLEKYMRFEEKGRQALRKAFEEEFGNE